MAQEDQGQPPPETVTVTFELTIEGDVPEGRTFGLGYKPIGNLLRDFRGVVFCTTDFEDPEPTEAGLPPCENAGTYYGSLEVPAGVPFSFDFLYNADADNVRCDYIGPPRSSIRTPGRLLRTLLFALPTLKTDFRPAVTSSEITAVLATVVPLAVSLAPEVLRCSRSRASRVLCWWSVDSWFAGTPGSSGGHFGRRRGGLLDRSAPSLLLPQIKGRGVSEAPLLVGVNLSLMAPYLWSR